MPARPVAAIPAREADLAAAWAAAPRGPLRLADGRALRVIFPGVPAGGSGPDFQGAILDAGGDILRGDVELHLLASGWRAHGHHTDPAYAAVCLHVVAANDTGSTSTLHASGRAVPVLVLPPFAGGPAFPPPFTPPCAIAAARGLEPGPALERLARRRLRMKAARAALVVESAGPAQALYSLVLEQLGGSANREPFAAIARRLPLAALRERAAESEAPLGLALAAELKGAARSLVLRRAGLRPMAEPGKRLEAAAALIQLWWPALSAPAWPERLSQDADLLRPRPPGIGRATMIELAVNAILPVAVAACRWSECEALASLCALPSPGTYGRLTSLERWVGRESRSFATAAQLQGALLLHNDYCTKGQCGRCPLSE